MDYSFNDKTILLLRGNEMVDKSPRPKTVTNKGVTTNAFGRFENNSFYLSSYWAEVSSDNEFNFGKDDFTIDWWEFALSAYTGAVFSTFSSSSGFYFGKGESGKVRYSISPTGVIDANTIKEMGNIKIKSWVHRAIVRDKNIIRAYENGVLVSENDYGDNEVYFGNQNMYFGRAPSYYFNGYIDEFRITKEAIWKSNFDVPVKEYTGINISHSLSNESCILNVASATSEYTINNVKITFNGGGVQEITSGFDNITYTIPKELMGIGNSKIKINVTYNSDKLFSHTIDIENTTEHIPETPNINNTLKSISLINSNTNKHVSIIKEVLNDNGVDVNSIGNISGLIDLISDHKIIKYQTGEIGMANDTDNFQLYGLTSSVTCRILSIPELTFEPDIIISYLKNFVSGTYYTSLIVYIKAFDVIFSGQCRNDSTSTTYQKFLTFKSKVNPVRINNKEAVLPIYYYTIPANNEKYIYHAFKL